MRIPRRLGLVGLAVLALPACGTAAGPGSGGPRGAIDGDWVLAAGTVDGARLEQPTGRRVTLVVAGDAASGTSACNQYTGTVQVDGPTVTFRDLGGTEMACDPPIMALEQDYLTALADVQAAANEGDQLVLTGNGIELRFDPVAPAAPSPLIGTVWQLESLLDKTGPDGTARSTVGNPATLELRENGEMIGSTGCNEFTGSYEIAAGTVSPGALHLSVKGCLGVIADQEMRVVAVLRSPFSTAIAGDRLTVTGADGSGLEYRAAGPTN